MIMTHDECIYEILEEYKKSDKKHFTNTFLAGLTGDSTLRKGLPILAIMQTFEAHKIEPYMQPGNNHEFIRCEICGNFDKYEFRERPLEDGIDLTSDYYDLLYFFKHHNSLSNNIYPTERDFEVFKEIFYLIKNAEKDEKIRDVLKKIKKLDIFKEQVKAKRKELKERGESTFNLTNVYEYYFQTILETLGYCSILETKKHKGYLTNFTPLGFTPKTGYNSDWEYPVDFWKGAEGINMKALKFWFGEYDELKELFV